MVFASQVMCKIVVRPCSDSVDPYVGLRVIVKLRGGEVQLSDDVLLRELC